MRQKLKLAFLIFNDIVAFFLSLLIALLFYTHGSLSLLVWIRHFEVFSFIFFGWIIIFYIEGLYSVRSFRIDSLTTSILRAHIISALLSFAIFYFFPLQGLTPKTNLVIIVVSSMILTFFSRKVLFKIYKQNKLQDNLIVLDNNDLAEELEDHLSAYSYLGIHLSKSFSNIEEFLSEKSFENVNVIAIHKDFLNNNDLVTKLMELIKKSITVVNLTDFFELTTGKIPIKSLSQSWFIDNSFTIMNSNNPMLKSAFDKFIALIVIMIAIPFYIVLIPVLILFSGFPLFYSQKRTGLQGKDFKIYKLRTMTVNAESNGAQWSKPGDARVTKIGRFLRATRLDELPQLYNIMKGDMSLVGPRPERPEIILKQLNNIPFYEYRHLVKPGVTGWAQVNYRYGYSEDDTIKKLQYDLYYVKNQSIWLDIRIILKTIKTVITGSGL